MQPRSLTVVEDGGLAKLSARTRPGQAQGSASVPRDPAVLTAVRDLLLEQVDVALLDPVAPAAERNPVVLRVLREAIGGDDEAGRGPLRGLPTDEASLLRLFRETLGWGPAQSYLDDERVQEVKIVGDLLMVQEDGSDFVLVPERFASAEQPLRLATLLASRLNVQLDRLHPQGTLPLAHGTRMHVTIPPCSPEGAALICIRRGRRYAWNLDELLHRSAFSEQIYELLALFARARCSFLIAGETGTGKTALLESLVNSWPGEPHVVTIEDNTLEINVRHRAWTRELVQTATERGAFGRAAKEALRQTPTVVAPGEIRAEEAGAILSIAVSGHAIVTTLHAKSCTAAVQRLADCAAMPGAYVYEGRRDNALDDICDNVEIVIHVEKAGGRRFVGEIALLNGVDRSSGIARPHLVPLARADVDDDGKLVWHCAAQAQADSLSWKRGEDLTPLPLQQKLRRLRTATQVRAMPTTRAAVDDALARAAQAVAAGQHLQAVAALRRAWVQRRDQRLVAATARAIECDMSYFRSVATRATTAADTIATSIAKRAWRQAREQFDAVMSDLTLVAAHTPSGGWDAFATAIERGLAADTRVVELAQQARQALDAGYAHDALDILQPLVIGEVSREAALQALYVRRDAVLTQVREGDGQAYLVEAVDAMIASVTRNEQEEHDA